jgi:hypothetical protein
MKTIHKYQLPRMAGTANVLMPQGAHILCVREQQEYPCLWALVDDQQPLENRQFLTRLTGGNCVLIENAHSYIGTAIMENGGFVVHVFDGADT